MYHYKTNANPLIADHNQICVLLENASRYTTKYETANENLIQDYLNEIVQALFDTHFKHNNIDEKYSKIMKMFQQSFANAENFDEDMEE